MKIRIFVMFVSVLLVLISCTSNRSIEDKLTTYVDKIEKNCASYSEDDWRKVNIKFETLVDRTKVAYEDMSAEERNQAMRAIGRYYGLVTKQGIKDVANEAKKILGGFPSLIKGFTEAFE